MLNFISSLCVVYLLLVSVQRIYNSTELKCLDRLGRIFVRKLSNLLHHRHSKLADSGFVFLDRHIWAICYRKALHFQTFFFSAKFEECDVKIPRIQTLNYFVQNAFLTNEFRQMELLLLEFFCWNLVLPTSGNFENLNLARNYKDPIFHVSF